MGMEFQEELFCSGKVLYNGQIAGMILADDRSIAIQASNQVQINYKGNSNDPILTTMDDVFDSSAIDRIVRRPMFDKPETSEGNDIKFNLKGNFKTGGIYHLFLETYTCIAIPQEDDELTVYASTQWMNHCQSAMSKVTKVPENKINMEIRRIGGGFGGKQDRSCYSACAAAMGAVKSNRPVRVVMTMGSAMRALGKRYPVHANYEVDVNDDGKIQKLEVKYYNDHGNLIQIPIEFLITVFIQNLYNPEPFKIIANAVVTDAPVHTIKRSPGSAEGMAIIENIMDHIAYVTGKDPISVRLANAPNDSPIRTMLPNFVESSDYQKRKAEIDTFNLNNRWIKRGIGIIAMKYDHQFSGHFPAIVTIHHVDGTVSLSHGAIEMGQGVNTKAVQIAAATLGIPVEMIRVKPTNNLATANSTVSGGSVASDSASMAS